MERASPAASQDAMLMDVDTVDSYPPIHEWGLNPSIMSFRKVAVGQVLKDIEVVPSSGHLLFYLYRTPILKVHIVGLVVSADIKIKRAMYHIDDGTGVVRCVKFLNENQAAPETFAVGQLVMVKGSLERTETNYEAYGFAVKIAIMEELLNMDLEALHMVSTVSNFRSEL